MYFCLQSLHRVHVSCCVMFLVFVNNQLSCYMMNSHILFLTIMIRFNIVDQLLDKHDNVSFDMSYVICCITISFQNDYETFQNRNTACIEHDNTINL